MNMRVADFLTQASSAHPAEPISRKEAHAAQRAWADMVLSLSEAHRMGRNDRAQAEALIRKIYDFDRGPVLVKPAYALDAPVRTELEDVVSYYAGAAPNGRLSRDAGFALRGWRKIRFGEQHASFGQGTVTLMGACHLSTERKIQETNLDCTMTFRRDAQGAMRMTVHHSSIQYQPMRGMKSAA